MKIENRLSPKIFFTVSCISVSLLIGCSNYEPVPKSKCKAVVKHAKKILADFAPSNADMLKDCNAASDSERGCIMAASKKGHIAQCY